MYELYVWAIGAPNMVKVFEGKTVKECEAYADQMWSYGLRFDVWKDDELVERW